MIKEQVYYDPRVKAIFTIKRHTKRYLVISGLSSPYIDDARTNLMRYRITRAYFKGCQPIDETSKLLINDGIGFKLANDNPSLRVYKNPNFKYLQETEELVKANRDTFPDYDYFDFPDDYPEENKCETCPKLQTCDDDIC